MKRLTFDVYDDVHHKVKLIAFSRGVTIKTLLMQMIDNLLEENIIYQEGDKHSQADAIK
ncbi:hypothetical protein [Anaplasma marginale]|uniref:hypothetical protein n=1 Tax=Anaplasma marginale TaxID=770 RepID=UPI0002DE217A|nr:hypothetical protein [Anaplasma marginale]